MNAKESVLQTLESQRSAVLSEDAQLVRNEWTDAIEDLFARIAEWLRSAGDRKLLEVRMGHVSISEERLGTYSVPTMEIALPLPYKIELIPKARFIGRGKGRVDVRCVPKEKILVRRDDDVWEVVELDSRAGYRRSTLTEETFWTMFGQLIG